jgi:hypothetical protein
MARKLVDLHPFGTEFLNTSAFPQLALSNERPILWFDGATDEECCWTFVAPQGLTGTLTLILLLVAASATSGTVRFQADVEAITPGDSVDTDATTSFDTTNSGGASVAGTAGYLFSLSITVTNADSIAAGDLVRLRVRRDADGTTGTDDVTTDVGLLAAELRDAA